MEDVKKDLSDKMIEFKLSNVEIMLGEELGSMSKEDYKDSFAKAQAINKEKIQWLNVDDSKALAYTTIALLGYEDFGLSYLDELIENHKDLLKLMFVSMIGYLGSPDEESENEPEILEK